MWQTSFVSHLWLWSDVKHPLGSTLPNLWMRCWRPWTWMCIGRSTHGASNTRGQYNGFSALLSEKSPTQDHEWCCTHPPPTECVLASGSLLFLLNNIAVFIRFLPEDEHLGEREQRPKTQTSRPIGETRWWSKDVAVSEVFGSLESRMGLCMFSTPLKLWRPSAPLHGSVQWYLKSTFRKKNKKTAVNFALYHVNIYL